MFRVEYSEGYQHPEKDGNAEAAEKKSERERDSWGGFVHIRKRAPRAGGPEHADSGFNKRVAPRDTGAAGTAAATEGEKAEKGDVFPPLEGAVAGTAVGVREDDALIGGPSAEAHVEEAAEGQAQQCGEDGSQDAEHWNLR